MTENVQNLATAPTDPLERRTWAAIKARDALRPYAPLQGGKVDAFDLQQLAAWFVGENDEPGTEEHHEQGAPEPEAATFVCTACFQRHDVATAVSCRIEDLTIRTNGIASQLRDLGFTDAADRIAATFSGLDTLSLNMALAEHITKNQARTREALAVLLVAVDADAKGA